MEWIRGEEIGRGSFATISKAKPRKPSAKFPPIIAVKSSDALSSSSLRNEKSVLDGIGYCANVVRCFGDENTVEDNKSLYNLVLEYASRGSLADWVKRCGGRLPEQEVRRHTRSVLKGLSFIHAKGFVHCDIKLQNVLVFADGVAKIADFGLAKEARTEHETRCELRGTPLYMSPESVNENEYEPPCDVWALGCAVAEMATGRPVWAHKPGSSMWPLLMRIGGQEEPEIFGEVSEAGRDFLNKCFIKDPRKRWTAEMLLSHPFVADIDGDHDHDCDDHHGDGDDDDSVVLEASPRCPFDFPEWLSGSDSEFSPEFTYLPADPVRKLVAGGSDVAHHCWSLSESWVTVRDCNNFC